MTPVITFLSDFGLTDSYIGICRAGIAGIAPGATVIDLVHTVPALDVRRGATIAAPIRNVDCYGNVQLTVTRADLRRAGLDGGRPVRSGTPSGAVDVRRVASFSDLPSGEVGIVEDSFGWLAIVAGGADAADRLALHAVEAVRLGDD